MKNRMWYIWYIWYTINDGNTTYSLSTRNPNVCTENSWYWWCSLANRKSSLTLLVVEVSKPVHTTSDGLLHTALWLVLLRPGDWRTGGWLEVSCCRSERIDWRVIQCQATIETISRMSWATDRAPFDVTISFNCLVLNTCIMIEDSVYRFIFKTSDWK